MSRSGYYVFVRRQDRLRLSLKISHQGLFILAAQLGAVRSSILMGDFFLRP